MYRVLGIRRDDSEVILAHTESPGLAHIIAEHLILILPEYAEAIVQEFMRGRGWRAVRVVPREAARTVQINRTLVRYTPA